MYKYNNAFHNTIKTKTFNVKLSTGINSIKWNIEKYCKFKIGDIARILKHKNIFAKVYTPHWSEKIL